MVYNFHDLNSLIPERLKRIDHSSKNRVLIIGLDGFSFNFIDSLIEKDNLPNMKKFIKNGASFKHLSSPFFQSYNAWSTLVTGTNSAKNGIYSYETKVPGGYKFVATNSKMRAIKAYWKILSDYGKKVVVLDIPGTYPPEEINGIMVTSLYTPKDSRFTYPENLSQNLSAHGYSPRPPEVHIESRHHQRLEEVSQLAHYLKDNIDWDCFTVCFAITDAFHHLFGSDKKKLNRFYMKIDEIIGDLTKELDEKTTVIICSDHGSTYYKKAAYLERWLHQEGFLKLKEGKQLGSVLKQKKTQEKQLLKKKTKGTLKYWISLLLKKYLHLKKKHKIPKIPFIKFPDWAIVWKSEMVGEVPYEWDRTKAYLTGGDTTHGNVAGLWLNSRNKSDENIKKIEHDLKEKLYQFQNPETGKNIVKNIILRKDLFHGKYIERLPHLLVQFSEGYHVSFSYDIKDTKTAPIIENLKTSELSHYSEGAFILSGEQIEKKKEITNCSIMDIVPTILYLLDVPIPSYLDGEVLVDAIKEDTIRRVPIKTVEEEGYLAEAANAIKSSSPAIDEEIKKELKKMGYIKKK